MQSYLIKSRKSISKISLIISLTIIVILFQLVSIKGTAIYLEYIALALFMFVFVTSKKFELLCVVLFLLPSNQYINFGNTSIITILVTFYFLRTLIFNIKLIHVPLLLLGMVLIGYTVLFGNFGTISIAIKTFLYLYFCIDVFTEQNSTVKQKYTEGIKFLVIGIIVSSFISVLLQPDVFNIRFSLAQGQSTNTLGILAGFAIGCILMLIQNEHIYIKKAWLFTVVPLAAVGFLTQSRSFIFTILIAIVWCLVYGLSRLNKKQNFRFLMLLVGLCILLNFIINSNGQWAEVINNALDRIINPKNNDISNSRFVIWSYYLNEFSQNNFILIFGKGTLMSSSLTQVAHNLWLEQLYLLGIAGNIIVISMFVVSIKYIYKKTRIKKLSLYGYLPLIMIFASSFFSHTFVAGADTIRFFLAVLAVGVFTKTPNRQFTGI
ncbi:O-antigen ligase family protein [Dehalobacterium formicoaceticum]|uniref:O-antigen ligase family protein n=1 Tax=Dehalobacterium formicoaceticum TaxID=51515 RepID=A0ABT1Y5P0_9FIRM|nr:O-antigen ligase family protein [Dehalobacterium formicoaceticum]MCR6546202.1 O-antigen ligase family protein [Dehalobacterium formicoaceticum]